MFLSVILGSLLVLSYVMFAVLSVVTVVHQPGFQFRQQDFDLRLNMGDHVMLIRTHSSIVWEEPWDEDEGYFPIHDEIRVPVSLGYKVEQLI